MAVTQPIVQKAKYGIQAALNYFKTHPSATEIRGKGNFSNTTYVRDGEFINKIITGTGPKKDAVTTMSFFVGGGKSRLWDFEMQTPRGMLYDHALCFPNKTPKLALCSPEERLGILKTCRGYEYVDLMDDFRVMTTEKEYKALRDSILYG